MLKKSSLYVGHEQQKYVYTYAITTFLRWRDLINFQNQRKMRKVNSKNVNNFIKT